ncbi:MAG: amino acid ABC transporter permease [Clostridia bacterium]|nr:amino acid ABC transporter permease [Clostridia bacterium]
MIDWAKLWNSFTFQFIDKGGYKEVLRGLGATVQIAVFGLIIGIIVGMFIAIIKVMPKYNFFAKILDKFAVVYVAIFRGTPMVVQLLVGHYFLRPLIGWTCDPLIEAIVIFGLNSGAYVSEIMRGGIQSIDVGQLEAGRAVGLTFWTAMFRIVIPQAIKNIIPTLGNEFITLVKETSVASFVTVLDLYRAFEQIGYASYSFLIPYLVLALIYIVLIVIITIGVKLIERRLKKNERKN